MKGNHCCPIFKAAIGEPEIQHFLKLGLEKILEISSCGSYVNWKRLLTVRGRPPANSYHFLYHALRTSSSLICSRALLAIY
ncbi:hypothetical protein F5Y05DRAFT_367771 [Hypoxylon sp. FL0543]|nr:hypothetical protein F5Y05DRAFT_367771 [Hypoxylon sp. FL0543]